MCNMKLYLMRPTENVGEWAIVDDENFAPFEIWLFIYLPFLIENKNN